MYVCFVCLLLSKTYHLAISTYSSLTGLKTVILYSEFVEIWMPLSCGVFSSSLRHQNFSQRLPALTAPV